jgi:hypothetical protein
MCSLLIVLYIGQSREDSFQQVIKHEGISTSNIWNGVCWSNHVFVEKEWGLSLGTKVESRFLLVISACIR